MVDFSTVESLIKSHIEDAVVNVTDLTGTQDHLGIMIISDAFMGKMLIQQHQMIMDILKEKLGTNEIHAVQLKTMTKEKAKAQGLL
ncbi:MAG: BolA family transcriptional regulator [Bacteriovoracaceae bacterium]|nr:BolA family transcriptional regulator [Bacteriovoracaceae bacterium]